MTKLDENYKLDRSIYLLLPLHFSQSDRLIVPVPLAQESSLKFALICLIVKYLSPTSMLGHSTINSPSVPASPASPLIQIAALRGRTPAAASVSGCTSAACLRIHAPKCNANRSRSLAPSLIKQCSRKTNPSPGSIIGIRESRKPRTFPPEVPSLQLPHQSFSLSPVGVERSDCRGVRCLSKSLFRKQLPQREHF